MASPPSAYAIELPMADSTPACTDSLFPINVKQLSRLTTDLECNIARPERHVGFRPGNQ